MDENIPPHSLGLVGDGDEIDAIGAVERRFSVKLDYSDASNWRTAGDVFAALKSALPSEKVVDQETWRLFSEAISSETFVDSAKVTPETLLLGTGGMGWRGCLLFAIPVCLAALAISHFA